MELFTFNKTQNMFCWRKCLSFIKTIAGLSFLLTFMACDKKSVNFHLVWETMNNIMNLLLNMKHTISHALGYGPDANGIFVDHSLNLSIEFEYYFLFKTIGVRLLSCCTFLISFGLDVFSNPLHYAQIDMKPVKYLSLCFHYECQNVYHDDSKFLKK